MKAQISSMNLLPLEKDEKDKKKYSGVYQQQGRMLTDADWNELQDIVKQRQAQAFDKTVKSGVPRNGGILEIVEDEGKYTIKEIKSGALFVDGIYAEVLIDPGEGDFYKKQHGFKMAPELPDEWTSPILYADVWERIVIANEDPDLRDPALHGADTCVRTQVLAQLKYAPDQDALYSLPATGDACFFLIKKPKGGDKPGVQGASDSGSCMQDKASEPRLPNCLFRLEVHEVKGPANNPDNVTLKWSSENGAEAVKYDGDPNQLDSNKEFYRKEYVYEFYNEVTEQHLGVHCQEQEVQRAKLVSHDKLKTEDLKGLNFVRRWDGYCDLKLKHERGQWIIQKFVSEGTSWENDKLRELEAKSPSPGEFLLPITVKDATLEMTLKLNKETRGVGGIVTRTFVAGDCWLARIRSDAPKNDQVQVLSETPVGIVHHYLELADYDNTENKYRISDTDALMRLSFPPLTDLKADRVEYDPQKRQNLWKQFEDEDAHKGPFDTVQKAIDELVYNMGGEKWPLTVGYGGRYETIREAVDDLNGQKDIVLCLLPKPRADDDDPPVHEIKQDIVKGRSIYLFGSGQEATEVRFHQSVQLKAKEIHLSRIHFQGQGRESQLKLMGEKVTSTHCKFEKAIGNDEELHKWSCVLNTQPPASTGTGRPDPTPPDSSGGGTGRPDSTPPDSGGSGTGRSAVPSASLVVGTGRPIATPPDSGGGGTGGHGGTPPDSGGGGSTFADTSDRRCVALDADNNVIVAGTFQGTMSFTDYKDPDGSEVPKTEELESGTQRDVFVVKFDADGAYLWSRHFGGDETEAIEVNRIVSDSIGDVVLIGSFKGRVTFSNFGEDEDDVLKSPAIKDSGDRSHAVFVVKIDKDGDYMWSHYFGAKEPNVETRYIGTDVAVDTQNYIYLTGVFSGETELNNFKKTNITVTDSLSADGGTTTFVLKLNSQGDYIWSAMLTNDIPDSSEKEASAWSTCAVDSKQDLIVVRATERNGTFAGRIEKNGPGADETCFTAITDILLTKGFVTSICIDKEAIMVPVGPVTGGSTTVISSPATSTPVRSTSVDLTAPFPLMKYLIYLTGYYSEKNGDQDLRHGFVSKYDLSQGRISWERKIGGKHNSHATSLTVDGAHNVYVTGGFEGSINLGGEDLVARHSDLSPPTQDAFLAKYTKNGHHIWSQAIGAEAYSKSNSYAVGPTIAVAANGEIVITGQCIGQIDLGGGLRGDPSRRGAFIGAFRTPQVLRPIVSLQRRGDHRMELHWLANEMSVTGDDLVRPGDLLALSKNTMGVIRDNVIQGDIRLMSDLSGSQQRIELLKSGRVLNIFHTDGLSLHIQGNRLNSVRANVPAMPVDGEITRIIIGYESLTVADNRFNGSPSYFLGRNVVVQGNQFLGRGTNAAVVVSQRLSLTDNVAREPDAVAFQAKPPGEIRKFRVNDFYVESANGMSKFEVTDAQVELLRGDSSLQLTEKAFDVQLSGSRALRIELGSSPNILSGWKGNNVVESGVVGATISGGGANAQSHKVSANYATISGGTINYASEPHATIGGGHGNDAEGECSTVGGGKMNRAGGVASTVGGGERNESTTYATVSGGKKNNAIGRYSTVGGGEENTASLSGTTVSGGKKNEAIGRYSTVGGGKGNTANEGAATVGGGNNNAAKASYATVPGGQHNEANGDYSFAAGHYAKAQHKGSFVWADSEDVKFESSDDNQFLIRARGGVGIGTSNTRNAALAVEGDLYVSGFICGRQVLLHIEEKGDVTTTNSEYTEIDGLNATILVPSETTLIIKVFFDTVVIEKIRASANEYMGLNLAIHIDNVTKSEWGVHLGGDYPQHTQLQFTFTKNISLGAGLHVVSVRWNTLCNTKAIIRGVRRLDFKT